jgi:hypothetical protein
VTRDWYRPLTGAAVLPVAAIAAVHLHLHGLSAEDVAVLLPRVNRERGQDV